MRTITVLLVFVFHLCGLSAQTFVNVSAGSGIIHSYNGTFGSGVSFQDWDKDGWPDLSFCNRNTNPQFYKNNNGVFTSVPAFFGNTGNMRSLIWVDYDNDGDYDIACTRHNGLFSLYRNDDFIFSDVTIPAGFPLVTYLYYGNTWADFDRDGDLDVYLAIYDETPGIQNLFYQNNGDGTFTEIGMQAGISNGSQFSFLGAWCDVNRDLWPDLYVINDKYYPNNLYINNGDGTFTDVSDNSDAGLVTNPMTATIDDYDHDFDLDIYMTNTDIGNTLLNNDGQGNMTEVAAQAGVQVFDITWGSLFSDFNHDMWPDLLVCSGTQSLLQSADRFFINDQDGTFTLNQPLFSTGANNSYCPAEADFDNDGDNDVAILCALGHYSQLFRNDLATGNHIKINLESTQSAPDGIGSWIDVYVEGFRQSRYTFCGENYLGQNSQYELFALGENLMADSIVVSWLSGHIDKFYDVAANQCLDVEEGSSLTYTIPSNETISLCTGEVTTLDGGDFAAHLWSNGYEGRYLTVSESGNYAVQVENEQGFTFTSNSVAITFFDAPEAIAMINHNPCFGDSLGAIFLEIQSNPEPYTILWNNGSNSDFIEELPFGDYQASISNAMGCESVWSYTIEQPESALTLITDIGHETNPSEGHIHLGIIGGTSPYQIIWLDLFSDNASLTDLTAGIYLVTVTDANGCVTSNQYEVLDLIVEEENNNPDFDFEELPSEHNNQTGGTWISEIETDYYKRWEHIRVYSVTGQLILSETNTGIASLLAQISVEQQLLLLHCTGNNENLIYKMWFTAE
jgi:hypothetical protein